MISWNVTVGLMVLSFILPFLFLRSQLQIRRRHARSDHATLEHLKHQLRALELHVAKDQSMFLEALGVPFLLLRRSGRLVMANREAGDLLGIDISRNQNLLHVLTNEELRKLITDVTQTNAPRCSTIRLRLRDGEHTFRTTATPLANEERHVGVVFHDVTEEYRTQTIRRDFVANASHELRTPLTIIRGYLETLLDEPETAADEKLRTRSLTVMKKHADRIVRLIEDMLTVSRLEGSDQTYLTMKEFDLAELVEDTRLRLESLIDARRVDFRISIEPRPFLIYGDKFYWSQILFNLLENALKNNQAPGLTLELLVSRAADGTAHITVRDNGVGISAEALPYIFNRFFRADKTGKVKGTGLGLSIVRHAVEAHGGTITAESTPGECTAFSITLPAHQAPGTEPSRGGQV